MYLCILSLRYISDLPFCWRQQNGLDYCVQTKATTPFGIAAYRKMDLEYYLLFFSE